MDMTMQLSRTVKGQEEIFNLGHTLRPRHRQILFAIGNGTSFSELRNKLPSCADLETMVNELLQSGFIQSLRNMATGHVAATAVPSSPTVPATPAQSAASLGRTQLRTGSHGRAGGNQIPGLSADE